MKRFIVLCAIVLMPAVSTVHAGIDQGANPPISVPGVRQVNLRNTTGGLSTYWTIPSSSMFRRHSAGRQCTFTAWSPGITSDGQHYVKGQVVSSGRWIFREGLLPVVEGPQPDETTSVGPLSTAVRNFVIYCDKVDVSHSIGFIQVSSRDSMFDPRSQLTNLYNTLQLERPVIYRNPVIDEWGGLITRYPAWLAIGPSAWRPERSNPAYYRGWTLYLLTQPTALDFQLTFVPNPERPSTPFSGIVPCVPAGTSPAADTVALPAVPLLPEQTAPGVNGPCEWTPPGPGTVTIEARITHSVTLWANGYTETQPDYVWSSLPVTYDTGELAAVNVNG